MQRRVQRVQRVQRPWRNGDMVGASKASASKHAASKASASKHAASKASASKHAASKQAASKQAASNINTLPVKNAPAHTHCSSLPCAGPCACAGSGPCSGAAALWKMGRYEVACLQGINTDINADMTGRQSTRTGREPTGRKQADCNRNRETVQETARPQSHKMPMQTARTVPALTVDAALDDHHPGHACARERREGGRL